MDAMVMPQVRVHVKKADVDLMVDVGRLPQNVREYLFDYGIRQKLNDSLASYAETPKPGSQTTKASKAEMLKMVTDLLGRLYQGETTARVEPTSPEAIAYKMASQAVFNAWSRKNPSAKPADFKDRHERTVRFLDANPSILAAAKIQSELAAIADSEV